MQSQTLQQEMLTCVNLKIVAVNYSATMATLKKKQNADLKNGNVKMNVYALFIMRFTTGLILPTHCSLHTSTCTQTHTLPHMLIDPITTTLLPAALHLSFHSNCTPLPSFFKPFIKRVSTIATRPHRTISALESIEKRNTKHQDLFHYPL